jgi:hypothetical protein
MFVLLALGRPSLDLLRHGPPRSFPSLGSGKYELGWAQLSAKKIRAMRPLQFVCKKTRFIGSILRLRHSGLFSRFEGQTPRDHFL